jgi:hypothetical protein
LINNRSLSVGEASKNEPARAGGEQASRSVQFRRGDAQ